MKTTWSSFNNLAICFEGIFLLFIAIIIGDLIVGIFSKKLSNSINEIKNILKFVCGMCELSILFHSIVFLIIVIITIFGSPEITFCLYPKDLETLPDGKYTYYVEIYNYDSNTTYTKPAIITKDSDCVDVEREYKECYPLYYLNKVYFSNGKYIKFSKDNEIIINVNMDVIDVNGDEYEVELLNKHAYIKGFKESHPSYVGIFFEVLAIITEILCWFLPIFYVKRNKRTHN